MDVGLPEHLQKLHGFAAWVPKHAALPRSIKYTVHVLTGKTRYPDDLLQQAVEQCVVQSLQDSASNTSVVLPLSGRLALRSFTYRGLGMAADDAVLAALPAATLTHLWCELPKVLSSASTDVLARLTNLRSLCICSDVCINCMLAVCQLPQLSSLNLSFTQPDVTLRQLPVSLRKLRIHLVKVEPVLPDGQKASRRLLNLQHLTKLERLEITSRSPIAVGSSLPAQLHHLTYRQPYPPVLGQVEALGITRLRSLQTLELGDCFEGAQDLAGVIALPHLQNVALSYWSLRPITEGAGDLLRPAAAWQQVRQLRSLRIFVVHEEMNLPTYSKLVRHMAALTGLTNLDLHIKTVSANGMLVDSSGEGSLCICKQTTSLRRLKVLKLVMQSAPSWCKADAHHLSKLTNLTALEVGIPNMWICSTAISGIASQLTNLEYLQIGDRWVQCRHGLSLTPLLLVGKLKKLRWLGYHRVMSSRDARDGLLYLTALTRLTELNGFDLAGRDALDSFWAMLRSNQEHWSEHAAWKVEFSCIGD